MADLTLTVDGEPIPVILGESTELATLQAEIATAAAEGAAISEATAESVVGPTYASTAAGLAATAEGGSFAVDNGDGTVTIYREVAGVAVAQRTLATSTYVASTYAPKANAAFTGTASFTTSGGRIGITNTSSPLSPEATLHVYTQGALGAEGNGLRVESHWEGGTGTPYENNDNVLFETFNVCNSSTSNRSWSVSAPNYTGTIPLGVTDGGERIGVQGWSVSVADAGTHEGTMALQMGVVGRAGFQGPDSATTAVVTTAVGVRGEIYADSAGATITNAYAGTFVTTAATGEITNNIAVYAEAANGNSYNYAVWAQAGKNYFAEQVQIGTRTDTQSSSYVAARRAGNSYEFGHPDANGYGSNIGATLTSGYPFLAFCGEAATGDTFRTRGKLGAVVWSDLAGALVFSRLTTATSSSQSMTESARFTAAGNFETIGNIVATGSATFRAGNTAAETNAKFIARAAGNTFEFGHPTTGGYGCAIGATFSSGYPFIALCCEAEATGNTFRTRGKLGTVIWNDLSGALVFARATNSNATGQSLTESARFLPAGNLQLSAQPILPTGTPASAAATGTTGQFCWDANYLYICTATNTWKRVAIATW